MNFLIFFRNDDSSYYFLLLLAEPPTLFLFKSGNLNLLINYSKINFNLLCYLEKNFEYRQNFKGNCCFLSFFPFPLLTRFMLSTMNSSRSNSRSQSFAVNL